ncbi:anaphase-promoting complex subunit 7 isoform X1 [Vespula maculifrons]|uniref:Anaphase-promoting complex subunit 7 n=5 Tax=Vespula TaxID=7451 RepID=A0A834JWJ2_VESGE|nr:anaphase-promoting complex subunit 7 isoform X1 [Vespula pensylvanica]XP_043673870.1 anaphase-promoting complex subunit 7 isoform X1 [Vespula pensylvanica]XP_043673871.1 anaphase-promoting complex subunit 7 isoform X1 [Vespula pensylvanica]XP_043673872.1 anaphase-promoting complex subunit 7 isoform X1 [Vespula pensylvanica]XP_043673873.1 anaphase-promoting complex subunit 7 isoform X2 [Vespula pensylvanica]XP_050857461.1 anaphase-promoting complex subunit 7 isoform X1 [Vespula vulgaris]XP_
MSGLYEQIKLLYNQSLYSNVISLANLVLSLSEHNSELLPVHGKFHVYVYYADAHFYLGKYRKAEALYKKALQFRKCLLKSKCTNKPLQDGQKDLPSDIDIKFQIHLCLIKLKNSQEALQVLQSIPGKQRTAKINMALAKMFHEQGMERSAITTYKEVLRECPLALEAAEGLLSLGIKGIEVNSLIVGCAANLSNLDWLNTWIKAHAQIHNREYTHAVVTLRSLDTINLLRDNFNLLTTMGECYYYAGDDKNALLCLRRARLIEPDVMTGVDIYAAVLYKTHHIKELERLISVITTNSENIGEIYVAMAYSLYASKKYNRANTLTAQALNLNPNDIEATILRGNILIEQKKYQDALFFFRHAVQLKPYRYEPHKGLIDCLVGMHRLREALNIASGSCKQLGHTPRVLTLYASVLMKDPVSVGKAKNLLEKALSQDEVYLPTVYLLAEIYEQEMNLEAAIELLERQVEIQPTCKLHQMLGDLWARVHNEEKALDQYAIALNLDPSNRRALEGMHRLDNTSSKLDSTYYMTVGEEQADTTYDVGDGLPDTDIDEAPDESETEAVWSDMDLEANSQ